ncbi:MAG: EF-P beta-lysylation protein EpmB [Pseudomonadota bacterium]|nr:EF-P beta-lysylation protein EpmB [Pseudomonadota bacterium]
MRIITRTEPPVEMQDWQQILAASFRDASALLEYLDIDARHALPDDHPALTFPVLVPVTLANQMQRGDINDPLLRQVLPIHSEGELPDMPGFSLDPLGEQDTNVCKGIIHKYHGRVLLLTATTCAINCRYCFRRHFDYKDNRLSRKQRLEALSYIAADNSISEVILSGGDPLMLSDETLAELVSGIEKISHVRRIRIHSRLPVVIPQRLTQKLQDILSQSDCQTSLVLHTNHGSELTPEHKERLLNLRNSGVTLLNQSVLLKGVNDDLSILTELSEKLFTMGVLPYYLHLADKVIGAHHFVVSDTEAAALYLQVRERLPGYLVPQLVREIPGEPYKQPYPVMA